MGAAVLKMSAILGGFPHFYSGSGGFGGAMNDGVLGRRDNADIKGDLLAVNPVFDEDVRWA